MNTISKLLAVDGYIVVNKELIKQLGLHEAIIIGELCSEYNYWDAHEKLKNDMFYSTRENIEKNTGLNEHYQRKAFATLQEYEVIKIEKKGLPAVNYYKINFDKLFSLLTTSAPRDEGLVVKTMDLNNNTNNNKDNKLFISKDINNSQNSITINNFIDLYHRICVSLPRVVKVTDKRKKGILNIIKKYSYDDIKQVFINLENSDFCKGKNDRGWKADLDFILREDKFVATLEGKYNTKKQSSKKLEVFGESDEVSNEQYTEEELAELEKLNAERRANGQRTHF